MTTCFGVFIEPTGYCFEKPRLGNPCGAWAARDWRGFRGFISTAGKFFKITIWITWITWLTSITSITSITKKIFSATEKNPINPEYPVFTIRPEEIGASPDLAKKSDGLDKAPAVHWPG